MTNDWYGDEWGSSGWTAQRPSDVAGAAAPTTSSLPPEVKTVTVTASFVDDEGNPSGGRIIFDPSVDRLVDPTSGLVIRLRERAVKLVNGTATIILIATDNTSLSPTGFTYTVRGVVDGQTQQPYDIALPSGTPTVNLAGLIPAPSSTGTVNISAVQAVNNDSGPYVTLTAAKVGADVAGAAADAQTAAAADATSKVAAHVSATDPHGDRADAVTKYTPLTDVRLTNARTPTAHATTHASGGSDPVTPAAIGALTQTAADGRYPLLTDSRLTDARTPTPHASTHASNGSDPVTPAAIGALTQTGADGRYPLKANLPFNVKDYGAKGDNTTDDTSAIQAALTAASSAGGGAVYLPAATYKISSALSVDNSTIIQGDGMNVSVIRQTSTTADCLTMTDKRYIVIRDLQLKGPSSGTGRGINFKFSASPLANLNLVNLIVQNFGSDGVHLETPITSSVTNVRSQSNGGHGFFQNSGTSVTYQSCYANGNTGNGFEVDAVNYQAYNACGSDSNTIGYSVNGSSAVVFNGCGSEVCQVGFKVLGASANISMLVCKVQTESSIAFWVTGNSTFSFLLGCREANPSGATAAIQVDAGSQATVINPQNTTANNFAAGTANLFQSTNLEVHSSGNSVTRVSRGATANTGRYTLQTANSDKWTMQLNSDSTDNWHLTDLAHTLDALVAVNQAVQPNLGLLTGAGAGSYGSGVGVVFIANASTVPSTNPAGGGLLYVDQGALKFRGSNGTVTTIAPA